MKKIIFCSLLCLSLNTLAQFIEAKPPTETELKTNNTNEISALLNLAHQARDKKDYKNLQKVMEKASRLKPNIMALKYQLAEAYALNDKKTEAYNALIIIQKQGFYYDIENNPKLDNLKAFPLFKYIKENMDANNQHFGEGVEAFNINKSFSGLLFESIAFDANSPAFLMGSLRDGRVIKIMDNGEITTLIETTPGGAKGPWATIDLAVDEKNDVLWVASASISQFGKNNKDSTGRSGVFKYKLSTGELLKSYLLPENKRPSMVSSITLTATGDVYFIGSLKNVVLKIAKDSDQISLAFATKKYENLRHLASDETGNVLYLSDSEEGIVILNLLNSDIYNFPNTEGLNLTGITDLIYDDNGLIFIQSGVKPERVMRIALDKSKFVVENIFPIDVANPVFNSPTTGTIVGQGIYYIANTQAAKTNMYGGLLKNQQWGNMVVLTSQKHYKEQESLEYKKTIEKHKEKTGSN